MLPAGVEHLVQVLPVGGSIGHNGLAGRAVSGSGEVVRRPALHHRASARAAYSLAIAVRERAGVNVGQDVIGVAGGIAGAGKDRVAYVVKEGGYLNIRIAQAAGNRKLVV